MVLGLKEISYLVTENVGAVDICATLNNSDYAVQFPFEVQLSTNDSNPGMKWYTHKLISLKGILLITLLLKLKTHTSVMYD